MAPWYVILPHALILVAVAWLIWKAGDSDGPGSAQL